jgi:outer membrane lipoprotein SlyB
MKDMRASTRFIPLAAALALVALAPACAPTNTGTTVPAYALGGAASVTYGTIVGTRPVTVAGNQRGVGTVAGAAAGGLAGSFIGGDWRSNAIAGIGGALIGGIAGNAIERGVTTGQAVEFIVRLDNGGDIAVVQTNEQALQAGERVVITRGDRIRISRAAGGPPPVAYAPPGAVVAQPISGGGVK